MVVTRVTWYDRSSWKMASAIGLSLVLWLAGGTRGSLHSQTPPLRSLLCRAPMVHRGLNVHEDEKELEIIRAQLQIVKAPSAIRDVVINDFLHGAIVVVHHLFADGTKIL